MKMFKVIYNAKVCEFIKVDSKEELDINIDEISTYRKYIGIRIEDIISVDTVNEVYPCNKSDCVYFGSGCSDVDKYSDNCLYYRKEWFNEYG